MFTKTLKIKNDTSLSDLIEICKLTDTNFNPLESKWSVNWIIILTNSDKGKLKFAVNEMKARHTV